MYVHALHTVHALPDLRMAAGRFAGRYVSFWLVISPTIREEFLRLSYIESDTRPFCTTYLFWVVKDFV